MAQFMMSIHPLYVACRRQVHISYHKDERETDPETETERQRQTDRQKETDRQTDRQRQKDRLARINTGRGIVSNLVFYAQSTSTVISGRKGNR